MMTISRNTKSFVLAAAVGITPMIAAQACATKTATDSIASMRQAEIEVDGGDSGTPAWTYKSCTAYVREAADTITPGALVFGVGVSGYSPAAANSFLANGINYINNAAGEGLIPHTAGNVWVHIGAVEAEQKGRVGVLYSPTTVLETAGTTAADKVCFAIEVQGESGPTDHSVPIWPIPGSGVFVIAPGGGTDLCPEGTGITGSWCAGNADCQSLVCTNSACEGPVIYPPT